MTAIFVIIGVLLFIGLVLVHELGHFLVARRNGIEVEEFGLGFPPRAKILGKRNGTVYSLNWLPLGGFVKLKGEYDEADEKATFGSARLWTKAKVLLAGVGMNLAAAFLLFTVLGLVGMPQLVENQFSVPSDSRTVRQDVLVGLIEPNSPAAESGLQARDKFVGISGLDCPCPDSRSIDSANSLPAITESFAGHKVELKVVRGDQELALQTTLRSAEEVKKSLNTDEPKGYLGVAPAEYTIKRHTWSAPVVALGTMWQFTELTFKGLGTAVSSLVRGDVQTASSQVGGPVAIGVLLVEGSRIGFSLVLMIIALISLTLAIMNILPIPALDGGRLFVTLGFRAFKKPLTRSIEEKIHGTGFVGLLLLSALIIAADIARL